MQLETEGEAVTSQDEGEVSGYEGVCSSISVPQCHSPKSAYHKYPVPQYSKWLPACEFLKIAFFLALYTLTPPKYYIDTPPKLGKAHS